MSHEYPQPEDGTFPVAITLAEQLAKLQLPSACWNIVWALFRKTYAWKKRSDHIALSQFETLTLMDRRHISRAVAELVERGIVVKYNNQRGRKGMMLRLNKNTSQWKTLRRSEGCGESVIKNDDSLPATECDASNNGESVTNIDDALPGKQSRTTVNMKSVIKNGTTKENITLFDISNDISQSVTTVIKNDDSFKSVVDYWFDQYEARFECKPDFNATHGKLIKRLLKAHGADMVRRAIDELVNTDDQFITEKIGITVEALSKFFNRLIQTAKRKGTNATGKRKRSGIGNHSDDVGPVDV